MHVADFAGFMLLPTKFMLCISPDEAFMMMHSTRGLQALQHRIKRSASIGRSSRIGRSASSVAVAQTVWTDEESAACSQLKKGLSQLDEKDRRIGNPLYATLLRLCGDEKSLSDGKRVHAHITANGQDRNTFLCNLLVQMYGRCGSVDEARAVFDSMRQTDMYSWSLMVAAHAQNGQEVQALELFRYMQTKGVKPNKTTFVHLLSACSTLGNLAEGKWIHERAVAFGFDRDVAVGNALVNMYGKCGSPNEARLAFDKMEERNVISWTSMIATYSQNGQGKKALGLLPRMEREGIKPDIITFLSILDACAGLASLENGKGIHEVIIASGLESDVTVRNALIRMYGKCGSLKDAQMIFDKMHERDVICWNAMITAYVQNGQGKEVLRLLQQMESEGVKPDRNTFLVLLNACADLVSLENGRAIHERIAASEFESDVTVRNALVDMYGKCGSPKDARSVFNKMHEHDVISWNAMTAAYAHNGQDNEILELFRLMDEEGVKPDRATFVSVLNACSHTGNLDEGWKYFVSMSRDYGLTPLLEHYVCMTSLLGQVGCLDEAEDLINTMHVQPSAIAWSSLIDACRIHGDAERGVRIAERLTELEQKNASPKVLQSNIDTAAGRRDDAAKVRNAVEGRGLKKQPGCCWIEVDGTVHKFLVGDTSHPQFGEMYAELRRLIRQMEEVGYLPDKKIMLCDVELEEKERMVCGHSEKMAVAFGLITTPCGAPLRIDKNLRICSDCHTAMKLISRIVGREIIVRDADRLHHFKHGVCSCGDHW